MDVIVSQYMRVDEITHALARQGYEARAVHGRATELLTDLGIDTIDGNLVECSDAEHETIVRAIVRSMVPLDPATAAMTNWAIQMATVNALTELGDNEGAILDALGWRDTGTYSPSQILATLRQWVARRVKYAALTLSYECLVINGVTVEYGIDLMSAVRTAFMGRVTGEVAHPF